MSVFILNLLVSIAYFSLNTQTLKSGFHVGFLVLLKRAAPLAVCLGKASVQVTECRNVQ